MITIPSSIKLDSLKQIAHAMALQFGSDCEVVIHDLTLNNSDNTIVHIENGHITGREIGGSPSQVVLDALKHHSNSTLKDKYAYLMRSDSGRILKCSTVFIRGDEGIPQYILGINYDISNIIAMESTIRNLTGTTEGTDKVPCQKLTHDVNDLLDELIEQSVKLIGVPVALMTKDDKVRAINYLNDAGAFLITRSGDKVSKYFGISKYTLYSYVDINK